PEAIMTELCKTAAPAYAIRIWANERSIFAELPSINGPYVAEFPRNEGGLSKALHTLGAMRGDTAGTPYTRPQDVALPSKKLAAAGVSTADLRSAHGVLKKLGVVK